MSKKRTAALGAGVLSALVVGGIAFAPTAVAAPEDSAYALAADGLVNITKVPHVIGEGKDHLVHTDLPSAANRILHAGVFNSAVEQGYAKASTTDVELGLPGVPAIAVGLVTAECDDLTGSTSVADLRIGGQEIALDQIGPNTEIIPDALQGIARITLNKQTANDDGSLTVSALSVDLLDGTQTVDLSTATCTEKPEAPEEPEEPTAPQKPSEQPSAPPSDDDGDNGGDDGDDGGELPGSTPDERGKAPVPVPQPGHLDVTG
ncbi:choice-of-anchor P family protein [Saccharomonospora xinjiangensis]|uniref:Uncharacterized protein n=1 Tax=Saccharomonospora xinjiangensis XJ-54 TaxID=882086 RepID=I0V3K7_9PSEU|nr:choice-of-anchor P family protein [Saccharomonospora xinjiangensis]EID54710.1 hypothetical protein SacxiDRAFT_2487 [Saccharomonospora xinjiangensis XJ-54]